MVSLRVRADLGFLFSGHTIRTKQCTKYTSREWKRKQPPRQSDLDHLKRTGRWKVGRQDRPSPHEQQSVPPHHYPLRRRHPPKPNSWQLRPTLDTRRGQRSVLLGTFDSRCRPGSHCQCSRSHVISPRSWRRTCLRRQRHYRREGSFRLVRRLHGELWLRPQVQNHHAESRPFRTK